MQRKKRKIIMFLDNATSHQDTKLSHVKLEFFPPNTTSKLQPLDLGIIRATKARYRKLMIRRLLAGIERCQTVTELVKKISVLDCIHWITKAWTDTKDSTIVSCFAHAGFNGDTSSENCDDVSEDDDDDDADDNMTLAQLMRVNLRVNTSQISALHDNETDIPIEETYGEDWEQALIDEHCASRAPQDDDSELDSSDDEQITDDTLKCDS